MPNIKGSVLRSRLEFVEDHLGPGARRQVLEALSEEDRQTLTRSLLPAQWYPFALGERLERGIIQALGEQGRDAFRQMGRRSADYNLKGVHQAFVHPGDPHRLLSRAAAIYKLYYDTGIRTYEATGVRSCRLTTHDSELASEADCLTVIGWHERAVELCGGRDVAIEHPRCRARGDAVCEYLIQWGALQGEREI